MFLFWALPKLYCSGVGKRFWCWLCCRKGFRVGEGKEQWLVPGKLKLLSFAGMLSDKALVERVAWASSSL
uniref:Uncharacterized protein n=2 Tax=Anguilla anguilla TaxID=7936 RepID=A0A0E9TA47_ANGAN